MDNTRQKGIALLLVCFALLLLSVIGLGMMYSTNMETAVNSNYRDKQVAMYAALAGLQEGRERIKYPYSVDPSNSAINPPLTLPSASFANVVYFVADSTIRPWDSVISSVPNRNFDTELCHESILSPSVTAVAAGIPCPGPYTISPAWFSSYDDSLSVSAPWNLSNPLDLKWVRIQLKANNNTPVAVNGDSTNGSQACWTGTNQISTPTSYSAGCQPTGGVTAVYMLTSGAGYVSAPTVAFTGGAGSGATGHTHLTPEMTGVVASIAISTGGSMYTTAPTVTITDPIGTGATATVVLSSSGVTTTNPGTVSAISLTTGGYGYIAAPTVTLTGGGGVGATATAILSSSGVVTTTGYVSTVTMTTGGASYTTPPTVSFSGGGGGSGATATAVLSPAGTLLNVAVGSVGTQCYSNPSDVNIAFSGGGPGTGMAATAVLEPSRSCVYSVAVTSSPQCALKLDASNGFSPIDQKAGLNLSAGGTGSGFSGTLFVSSANDKTPTGFSIQNPGHDTTNFSASTFTGSLQLSGAAWACSNIIVTGTTGYRLASINVTNPGSGYTSAPTVNITGGVGSTSSPTATATLGYPIASVNVTAGGSGYTTAPTVAFSGGGGSGAAANAAIITTSTTTYPVASVVVTAGGTGYSSAPTVSFSGGSGAGAAATASITPTTTTTYPVASVTVTNGGSGYSFTTPPTVTFSGGGGTGAAATATVSGMATGLSYVDSVVIDTAGSGYTSNPTVVFTGGGYTTQATAMSQISGGTKYGQVWLVTAFAQTKNGARAMLQQEVASPVLGFAEGGALTLDGPNPTLGAMPNSNPFYVSGYDENSCSEMATPPVPGIDGYDDPNADPPTHSVTDITDSLPRPTHYIGSGGTPSVQNGYAGLGETMGTPAGLSAEMNAIYNTAGAVHWNSTNVSGFNPNATNIHSINYVDGDLSLPGNPNGNGILVVTGTLSMSGDFHWNGIIFVVGDGIFNANGGGNATINGSLWVAKTWDASHNLLSQLGSPSFSWNGGGGNGIYYDHCLTTDLMTAVPPPNFHSTNPLKVLSFRSLPY